MISSLSRLLVTLANSGVWVALAATLLCAASARTMGIRASAPVLGLVFVGTLLVYVVDRLRDRESDRRTSPRRTAFVIRHEDALVATCWACSGAAAVFAYQVGWMPAVSLLPVAVLAFFHRRTKRLAFAKAGYVAAAWLFVVVVFPAVAATEARHPGWVALVLGAALLANAIASNVRDREAGGGSEPRPISAGSRRPMRVAGLLALAGVAAALAAPADVLALGCVPLAVAAALWDFRADEHHGLVVLDGALVWGGLAALSVHPWVV